MGWIWVLRWCRRIREPHRRLRRDRRVAPAITRQEDLEYIDNFAAIGVSSDAEVAQGLATAVVDALTERGLFTTGGEFDPPGAELLGWRSAGQEVRPIPARVWRCRLAARVLLRRGRMRGQDLERLLWSLVVIGFARRPS
eukprot:1487585-Lingulodinium_polyedra.AAC.1